MRHQAKILASVAFAIATAGCTDENTLPQGIEERTPVAICAEHEPLTRVDETYVGTGFTAEKRIGVFGYAYSDDTWKPSLPPDFFYNVAMTLVHNGTESDLTYSPVRYWPYYGNKKVALYGYYPYNGDATNIALNHVHGMGLFTYTTPENPGNQPDFMVSKLQKDMTASNGTVNLQFYHTLACIEINVDLAGTAYDQIKEVSVTNVYTKGVFAPQVMSDDLENNSDDWRSDAWMTLSDRKDLVVTGEMTTDESLDATNHDTYKLMLIPQQCGALNQIELKLYNTSTSTETTITRPLTESWEAGKTYTYEFKASATP